MCNRNIDLNYKFYIIFIAEWNKNKNNIETGKWDTKYDKK